MSVRAGPGGRRSAEAARTAVLTAALATALAVTAVACTERPTTHHNPGTSHEVATGSPGKLLEKEDGHGHRLRRVSAEQAPSVALTVRPDSRAGWNVRLRVRRFHFTPDSAGGAAVPGTGHARLYLGGEQLARVYGPWYHLPAEAVPDGEHTLTARLYADDHTAWAVGTEPVGDSAGLTAATGGTGDGGERESGRTVDISLADGRVSPAPGRIEVAHGDRITLRVTSDTDDELHVHGYDRTAALTQGRTTTLTLTADRTGLFEVETHESGLVLTQLAVR